MSRQSEAESYRRQPQTETERLTEAYKGASFTTFGNAFRHYLRHYNTCYDMANVQMTNQTYWQARLDTAYEGMEWFGKRAGEYTDEIKSW
jgi:hypothetical protein